MSGTEQVGTILPECVGPELLLSHPEQMGYWPGIETSVPLQWNILLDYFWIPKFGMIRSLELILHLGDVNSDSLKKTHFFLCNLCNFISSKCCSRHYLKDLLHQLLLLWIPNTRARKIHTKLINFAYLNHVTLLV